MRRVVLTCLLVLMGAVPLHALDPTDESGRMLDPALGIVRVIKTRPPDPPLFDAHFAGPVEKEFILYQWEPEECYVNLIGLCIGRTTPRWKRVIGISSNGTTVTGSGTVECGSRVVLTGWYRGSPTSTWVQVRTDIVSQVPGDKSDSSPIGVIARGDDGSGGYGTVEFIHGCGP